MELNQKKRLIGIIVLVGIVLLQLPFFLHNKTPEVQPSVSLDIPKPPTVPTISPEAVLAAPEKAAPEKAASENTATTQTSPATSPVAANQNEKQKSDLTNNEPIEPNKTEVVTNAEKSEIKASSSQTVLHISKAASSAKQSTQTTTAAWSIQAGVFSDQINAAALLKKLREKGYESYMRSTQCGKNQCLIVYVGPEIHWQKIQTMLSELQMTFRLKGIVKKYQL